MLTDIERRQIRRVMKDTESLNINGVRDNQLDRRVNAFIRKAGIADIRTLVRNLSDDGALRQRFMDGLTINVTNLFRNAKQWATVQNEIFPEFGPRPRIWSAGCSTGAEPYSISIIATEVGKRAEVVATDIDRGALQKANVAWYRNDEMREVPEHLLDKYFTKEGDGWIVDPSLRRNVRFSRHDLLEDPLPPGKFDMIACRNVAIYFSNEAKEQLHGRLATALKPNGVLFIGGAERISDPLSIGLELDQPQFYRKQRGI